MNSILGKERQIPKLTIILSAAIILAYLFLSSKGFFADAENIFTFGFSLGKMQNILSYAFIHSSYSHLTANIAIIIAAGFAIEPIVRKRDFIALFFIGSAFSALLFCLINPQYNLVGASAGAVSLLGASFVSEPKKTIAYLVPAILIGYLLISGITIYIGSVQEKINEDVKQLEEIKKQAVHKGDLVLAKYTQAKIDVKKLEESKIEEGIALKDSIPPNFEIHIIAATFGAIYIFLFRRGLIEKTALRMHHLLRP